MGAGPGRTGAVSRASNNGGGSWLRSAWGRANGRAMRGHPGCPEVACVWAEQASACVAGSGVSSVHQAAGPRTRGGGGPGGERSSCDSPLLLARFPTFIHLMPLVFIEQLLCARPVLHAEPTTRPNTASPCRCPETHPLAGAGGGR